jgi:hypothetical protein
MQPFRWHTPTAGRWTLDTPSHFSLWLRFQQVSKESLPSHSSLHLTKLEIFRGESGWNIRSVLCMAVFASSLCLITSERRTGPASETQRSGARPQARYCLFCRAFIYGLGSGLCDSRVNCQMQRRRHKLNIPLNSRAYMPYTACIHTVRTRVRTVCTCHIHCVHTVRTRVRTVCTCHIHCVHTVRTRVRTVYTCHTQRVHTVRTRVRTVYTCHIQRVYTVRTRVRTVCTCHIQRVHTVRTRVRTVCTCHIQRVHTVRTRVRTVCAAFPSRRCS